MLNKATIDAIDHRLNQAEKTGVQIRQISLDHPEMTIDDAYAVQKAWLTLKLAEGRTIKGHKIGLTSRAMQQSSQISEPDYGTLLDDMFFPEGSDLPMSRFIVPRVEVELAFILGKPLSGPNCTIFDVLSATDYVVPALEIIDQRCPQVDPETKRMRKVFDTISDNAANAAIVLGGRPVNPMDVDLRWVGALLYKNGVLKKVVWARPSSTTRRTGWHGWRTSSRRTVWYLKPGRSYLAAHSPARCRRYPVILFRRITARSGKSPSVSFKGRAQWTCHAISSSRR